MPESVIREEESAEGGDTLRSGVKGHEGLNLAHKIFCGSAESQPKL